MTTDRLTEIETRLAYNEHTLAELSDLVYAQSQEIERLTVQCRRLQQRLEAQADQDAPAPPPEAEVPPHY